jgi:CheY-like chemotaxis protein
VTGQSPRRVAIVDDELDMVTLYSKILGRLGYVTEYTARDGHQMLLALSKGEIKPEIVMMDFRMPLLNGLETARRIREIDRSIKVLLVTADDAARVSIAAAGFRYLQKPFSISELREHLEKL